MINPLSVQTDRFVHDRLPPSEHLARLRYDLPELQIAEQANLVDVLLAGVFARGFEDRIFLRSDALSLTYLQAGQPAHRQGGKSFD